MCRSNGVDLFEYIASSVWNTAASSTTVAEVIGSLGNPEKFPQAELAAWVQL